MARTTVKASIDISMQTIGQLLQSLRLKKSLSLEDISRETNIAPHLLAALEQDDFSKLPTSTFTKGFITNYARVIGLSSSKALAIFRRDFTVTESGKILPRGLAKPLDNSTVVGARLVWIGGIAFAVTLFVSYLLFQLRGFHAPPELEVIRPNPQAIVKGPIIPIRGFVSTDSTVYINSAPAEIFPTGEFRATVSLPAGDHDIVIKAINGQQRETEKVIPVTVVDK